MTYRYIYKITCTKGSFKDKFYFGQHTTNNLNDGYKGSGRKLGDYYKKYPNDYIKEIIGFYNTEEELNKAEYDIIKPWLNNEMCLNLRDGGDHNCRLSNETKIKIGLKSIGRYHSKESRKKNSESHKDKPAPWNSHPKSEETRNKISKARKGKNKGQIPWNKGKQTSEETKKKQSESHKDKPTWNKGLHGIKTSNKGRKAWNKGMNKEEMKNYKRK